MKPKPLRPTTLDRDAVARRLRLYRETCVLLEDTRRLRTELGLRLAMLTTEREKSNRRRTEQGFRCAAEQGNPSMKVGTPRNGSSRMPARRLVYQQGDHICTIYTSPEEQLRAAVEYVKAGLQRGERCLYVCGEHTPEQFRAALGASGMDVAAEEKRGALILITKHEGHLNGGSFSPDRMIHMLEKAVQDALDAGFAGLAAAGDMGWVLDEAPGTEHLAEYESRLNAFYANSRALGLCQYSRKLPKPILDHCIATHRVVRIDGPIALENPFYEPPQQAIGRKAEPRHVARKLRSIYGARRRAARACEAA